MKFLSSRQSKFGTYALVYTLLVVAVLVTVNWLASRHVKSFDATTNKRFSLADQTVKVVSGLKQDVTISYFQEGAQLNQGKDLLDRYDNLSPKLSVEYVDPRKKPSLARQYGVKTMGTVLVRTANKQQEARSLTEEEVTSALIRVLKDGQKTACFLSGFGEHQLEESNAQGYSQAKDLLERNNYKTQTIDFATKPELPQDCTVAVIAGPRYEYPAPAVETIKKYVEGGGSALFLLGVPQSTATGKASENKALLEGLGQWGVDLKPDELRSGGILASGYLLGPEYVPNARYGTHSITRDLRGANTIFLFARPVDTKSSDKATPEKLVFVNAGSDTVKAAKGGVESGAEVSIAVAGSLRTEKPGAGGRFVVAGSADWVSNSCLRLVADPDLFLNMMNWLSNDEDLISIRPKDPEDRRIQLSAGQMRALQLTSQFLLPLAVVIAGVMVWLRRR